MTCLLATAAVGAGYKSVIIGSQEWMAENLRTSTFRNGDPIPEAKTAKEWLAAYKSESPAWCYYQNDPKNGKKYGKLYNWYAVNDSRGLAPTGWHVATDDEWQTLITSLGGMGAAFVGLKDPNGFNALPSGARYYKDASFNHMGNITFWWTTDKNDKWNAWYHAMHFGYKQVARDNGGMNTGHSVRCVKDRKASYTSKAVGLSQLNENNTKEKRSHPYTDSSNKKANKSKKSDYSRIVIAVAYFQINNKQPGDEKMDESIRKTFVDVLNSSGDFYILNPLGHLVVRGEAGLEPDDIKFKAWEVIGARLLITGSVTNIKSEQVELKIRLFDTLKSSILASEDYTGPKTQMDKMIHAFCGDMSEKVIAGEYYSDLSHKLANVQEGNILGNQVRIGHFIVKIPSGWNALSGNYKADAKKEFSADLAPGLKQYEKVDGPKPKMGEFEIFQKPKDGQLIGWTLVIPDQTDFLKEILKREDLQFEKRKSLSGGSIKGGSCKLVNQNGFNIVRVDVEMENGGKSTNLHFWSPENPGIITTLMAGVRSNTSSQTDREFESIISSIVVTDKLNEY